MAANNEKSKGNEAYYSHDYKEALVYYKRSISILPVPAVYNNRAMTYIKLEQYKEALEDCETVLKSEPQNLKAFLRRGIAKQNLKDLHGALDDYKEVLRLEPTNKRGKELYEEVRKELESIGQQRKRGKRLVVEEIDSSQAQSNGTSTQQIDSVPKSDEKYVNSSSSTLTNGYEDIHRYANSDASSSVQATNTKSNKIVIEEVDYSITNSVRELIEKNDYISSAAENTTLSSDQISSENSIIKSAQKREFSSEEEMPVSTKSISYLPIPTKAAQLKYEGNELFKIGRYGEAMDLYSKALNEIEQGKLKLSSNSLD